MVTLDATRQSSKSWTGVSNVLFTNVDVSGVLHAGEMKVIAENSTSGWNILTIRAGGTMDFRSKDIFICNDFEIYGTLTIYNTVFLTGETAKSMNLVLGVNSRLKLDAESTHPSSDFTYNSKISASKIQTDLYSVFDAGDTEFEVKTMTITGTLRSKPTQHLEVMYLTIKNDGHFHLFKNVTLRGKVLSVEAGGMTSLLGHEVI